MMRPLLKWVVLQGTCFLGLLAAGAHLPFGGEGAAGAAFGIGAGIVMTAAWALWAFPDRSQR